MQKEKVMAMDIKTIQHEEYLEFVVIGSHDLNEAIDMFSYILATCKLTGLNKVLIDYRELIYPVGGFEKGLYAVGTEDKYIKYLETGGHKLQIAYLAPIKMSYEPGAEIGRKVESVQFELFDKLNKALEWLNIKNT
jgi:hypothetical protein